MNVGYGTGHLTRLINLPIVYQSEDRLPQLLLKPNTVNHFAIFPAGFNALEALNFFIVLKKNFQIDKK